MGRYQKKEYEPRGEGDRLHVDLEIDIDRFEEMVSEGLHGLAVEIGIEVAESLLGDEVERRCGRKGQRRAGREIYRYGQQQGSISMQGQRVAIMRPRMRWIEGGEVELDTYRRLQKETRQDAVMRRLVRGVSCRDYRAVVEAIRKGRGISASAVSRSFVDASAERVRQLAERRFDGVRFVALFIDGVRYAHETVIAAIGVTDAGEKRVLALRHGATENARTCVDLLTDLLERGISNAQRLLFVIDGSKALRSAIAQVWGERAMVQRCRVHKLRNVEAYVSKKHWPEAKARIQKAYAEASFATAKKSLETTARWLALINPHAAASLREGLDETLTVNRLGVSGPLRRSLATTNMVESVFSRVRMMTSRVKRWRAASMRERWCATALLHAERGFHRIYGHAQISTQLLPKLDANASVITKSA